MGIEGFGGFPEVRNLQAQAVLDEEEQRKQEIARLLELKQRADAAGGGPPVGYGPSRFEARADFLKDDPIPSVNERMQKDLGPELMTLAFESAGDASYARNRNPGGRMAEMDRLLANMDGGGSRAGTSDAPIYYQGSRATGAHEPIERMPYNGAVEGLRGAEVPRSAIRPEFGGTAKDEMLSFTNRPEVYQGDPEYRRYDSPSGTSKDTGAPGGDLGSVTGGGGPQGAIKDAIRRSLLQEREQAMLAPATPEEVAAQTVTLEPELYGMAQQMDPNQLRTAILEKVASREISPVTGRQAMIRFQSFADQATSKDGEFDRDIYNALLGQSAQSPQPPPTIPPGGKVEASEQRAAGAIQDVTSGPPGAPGTTPSPVLNPGQPAASATPDEPVGALQGFADAMQQGSKDRFGAPMPATPPGMAGAAARVGMPIAGGVLGGTVGFPNVGAGLGGAAGELLGQAVEGEPFSLGQAGKAGVEAAVLGKVLGKGAEFVGGKLANLRSAKALGQGIQGASRDFPPGVERMLQAEDAARVVAPRPSGAEFLSENLPAVQPPRQGFSLGERGPTLGPERTIPGRGVPAVRGMDLPAELDRGFTMGEAGPTVSPGRPSPADAMIQELTARGGGEGAKQLVPRLSALSPEAKDSLLTELRAALVNRREQGIPVTARDVTELLAMMLNAGG